MKKVILSIILSVLFVFSLSACNKECVHEWENGVCTLCGAECEHEWADNACAVCGSHAYEFKSVPEKYQDEECPEKGSVVTETITYEDASYGAYVYLPYGYDADADTQYNILYLLHGAGEEEGYWFKMGSKYAAFRDNITVTMPDNLIYYGMCDPLIIVTPCTYDILGTETGAQAGGDYNYFRDGLVKQIEAKYNTYAGGDVTEENLIATRDHRGMAGFSMGGMTTFSVGMQQNLDIIGWFGCYTGAGDAASLLTALSAEENANYKINFFYNEQGTLDLQELRATQLKMAEDLLKDGRYFKDGENFILNDKENKGHKYDCWIVDLYNTLTVSFFN